MGEEIVFHTVPVPAVVGKVRMRGRKLHLGHFAFMRAIVQGIDSKHAWNRFLRVEGDHNDVRVVRRTIAWIRGEFAAAAKRFGRPGTARLVVIDPSLVAEDISPAVPSLEEFVAMRGWGDFSEEEQLQAYHEEFGEVAGGKVGGQKGRRRERLIKKQLAALDWLERLTAVPPMSGDALSDWLHPDLVVRLEGAGVFTVRSLVDRINGRGRNWWRGIKAIGETKARRIEAWLRDHECTIGLSLGTHVDLPRSALKKQTLAAVVPRQTGVVPLEKLIVPAELDGSIGRFRAPAHLCMINAKNDYEAVLVFIRSKQGLAPEEVAKLKRKKGIDPLAEERPLDWLQYLSNTQRSYLKEVERALLWAIVERKMPLSSMTMEDCLDYVAFLRDPMPSDRWCGPRSLSVRWSPLWRPFEGPLNEPAIGLAVTVMKNFSSFLAEKCYLVGNPWKGIRAPKARGRRAWRSRAFSEGQWAFIEGQLKELPDCSTSRRLSFALHLLYAGGLRLTEAVGAMVDHLQFVSYPPDEEELTGLEGWELKVIGKGGRERYVPLPFEVVRELAGYLASRGLDPDPEAPANKGTFLLGWASDLQERAKWSRVAKLPYDAKAGISDSTLYDQLKAFFDKCAAAMRARDAKAAQRFSEASTHWLRHTHAAHALAAGTPLNIVQQNLDHASIDTTSGYLVEEDKARMKGLKKFFDRAALKNKVG